MKVYNVFDSRLPITVEELLRLPYHLGQTEDATTPPGEVQAYCSNQYGQIPYTVLSTRDLWRRGQYLEASLLVRHLLEVFVQMRYFYNRPADMMKHWMGRTPKDRTPFRLMFEYLVPGSYQLFYSLLSTVAHGSATVLFRIEDI